MRVVRLIFILSQLTLLQQANVIIAETNQIQFKTDSQSVIERALLQESVTPDDILQEHDKVAESRERSFRTGMSFAYLTPWNSRGYDLAIEFREKFTHLAPVWFQFRWNYVGNWSIEGEHDVHLEWIRTIRKRKYDENGKLLPVPKIVPRFKPVGWTAKDVNALFDGNPDLILETTGFFNLIFSVIKKFGFDGATLEVEHPQYYQKALSIIGDRLHSRRKLLFLVIPAPSQVQPKNNPILPDLLENLAPMVDGFTMNTYDYSSGVFPGPVSPLPKVQKEIETFCPSERLRAKLLLGINFYGYKYLLDENNRMEAVTGNQIIDIVKNERVKIVWDDLNYEHHFVYPKRDVYYPTLLSIDARIQLAEDLGVGISIWELGQGMDYFVRIYLSLLFCTSKQLTSCDLV